MRNPRLSGCTQRRGQLEATASVLKDRGINPSEQSKLSVIRMHKLRHRPRD